MGIPNKLSAGLSIICFILIFSNLISVFQLIKIRNPVSETLSDNIRNIELSKNIGDMTDIQLWSIFDIIADEKVEKDIKLSFFEDDFEELINNIHNKYTFYGKQDMIDSLKLSYTKYCNTFETIDNLFAIINIRNRIKSFITIYKPAYLQFRISLKKIDFINQNILSYNKSKIERSFFNIFIAPFIANIGALLLIISFIYFINLYKNYS